MLGPLTVGVILLNGLPFDLPRKIRYTEYMTDCLKCGMEKENLEYWIVHQTMSDNTIWCANTRSKKVEEMTADIVNRYKAAVKSQYGNKKRHRQ